MLQPPTLCRIWGWSGPLVGGFYAHVEPIAIVIAHGDVGIELVVGVADLGREVGRDLVGQIDVDGVEVVAVAVIHAFLESPMLPGTSQGPDKFREDPMRHKRVNGRRFL